jgi:hypothetical protein
MTKESDMNSRYQRTATVVDSGAATAGCGMGGCLAILAFNLTLGGVCFDYALWSIVGKDIPWYADAIAGLFLGQFAVPIAVICWVVKLCGVDVPFVAV